MWRHSCLWHSDATWPTSHFVAGRRTLWCLTSDKRGDLPEGVDHPGFRSAVREAPPLDRFVISHASIKAHRPRFQAEAPGSVRSLRPGSTAIKADCIGQSKRHGQLCQFPKSGTEVRQALPGLGMYEARDGEDALSGNKHISVKVSTLTKRHAWKPPTPASVAWINNQRGRAGASATQYRTDGKIKCLRALVYCCQVRAVAAQDELQDPYVRGCIYLLAALGFIALVWKIWQFNLWLYRLPEEPDNFEPDGPRQVTLQMRLLGPRDSLVLRVQRGGSPRNAECRAYSSDRS